MLMQSLIEHSSKHERMGGGLRSHQAYYCKQKRLKFLENDKFLTSGKLWPLMTCYMFQIFNLIQFQPYWARLGLKHHLNLTRWYDKEYCFCGKWLCNQGILYLIFLITIMLVQFQLCDCFSKYMAWQIRACGFTYITKMQALGLISKLVMHCGQI